MTGGRKATFAVNSRGERTGRTNPNVDLAQQFDKYAQDLWLFAAAISGDPSVADDALQQVFCSLLERDLSRIKDTKRYLCRAVKNATLNLARTEVREQRKREGFALNCRTMFSEPAGRGEELAALNTAMGHLGQEQREVVTLKVWGKLTFGEIGDVLGISPNTAASRYRYAIGNLRKAMGGYHEERI